MTVIQRLARRCRDVRGDAGFTLIEGLISMVIFMTCMAVMSSVVLAMTNNTRQAHGVSVATDQTRAAFQRLDRQVRYATAIGTPGREADGGYYVEFSMFDMTPDGRTTGAPKDTGCQQWRLLGAELQTRSWRLTPPPGSNPRHVTEWRTVAAGVMNDLSVAAESPFTRISPSSALLHQGLVVELYVKSSDRPLGRSQVKTRFFARNTDATTESSNVCKQVGRTA